MTKITLEKAVLMRLIVSLAKLGMLLERKLRLKLEDKVGKTLIMILGRQLEDTYFFLKRTLNLKHLMKDT